MHIQQGSEHMIKKDLENLKLKDLKHVMIPLKRGRVIKDCIDLGFDTEYTSESNSADRELISIQLALRRGDSGLYYINKKGITSEELLEYVLGFLNDRGVEPKKHIYLVTFLGIAELSKIKDFFDAYIKNGYTARPKVAEFNKAIRWEKHFGEVTLHIADLYGHMKGSLEKVGESLGFPKLKIEAEGKNHLYWMEHMKELSEKHPDIFEAYAKRDAELTIEAWNKLKEAYAPQMLDPHIYSTYTSLAIASFRRTMKTMPCPVRQEEILIKQRMKGEKWREHIAKILVYDGDFNSRIQAALSYWGGRNEAFIRGHIKDLEISYYDFISLYIIAGILQPLSNEFTKYQKIIGLKEVKDGYEGFAEVNFEFPEDEKYPCLPVKEDYYRMLVFPRRGTSHCTLAELREALRLNVKISDVHGYAFYPKENEIEHELKPFLAGLLQRKSSLEAEGKRGSMEYNLEKARMVGIIGRFAYMRPSHTAEDIARLLHESGLRSEEFRRYGKKKAIRALYTRSEVGGTWVIEWASLIVGKARAMTSSIVPQGEGCLLISTDGGFWVGDPKFQETELHKELAKYHSGIRLEGKADEFWVARNRCYAAFNQGAVLHSAMMGITAPGKTREQKELNFQNMIRESITARQEKHHEAELLRFTGLTDFIHENTPLNSEQPMKRKISWGWDYKRKLINNVNVFAECTDTKPYENILEAYKDAQPPKKRGRPSTLTAEQIKEIRESKESVRKTACKYGISAAYVTELRGR